LLEKIRLLQTTTISRLYGHASDSQHKGCSIFSQQSVGVSERMRSSWTVGDFLWLMSVLRVRFSALTVCFAWQEGYPICKNLLQLHPKVLWSNSRKGRCWLNNN